MLRVGEIPRRGGEELLHGGSGLRRCHVWEVIDSDRCASEVLDFAAFLKYEAHPEVNTPLPGTTTVSGSFAPTSFHPGGGLRSNTALPIPRFVGSQEPAMRWFAVEIQFTSLLLPFVFSQQGFDTSIIVSNVSADPLGTAPQSGSIQLHFYGDNAPEAVRTGSIPAGRAFSTLASVVAPDFSGYVIARCAFSPARGFAIIHDPGMRNVAAGCLAEVIDAGDNKVQRAQGPITTRRVSTLEIDTPDELSD